MCNVKRPVREDVRRRARNIEKNTNLKTLLWLWLFPAGISLMWQRSCTWHKGVKIGLTAAMLAALLAVIIIPAPTGRSLGSIEMVGARPEVEIYGPELPESIVPGYTDDSQASIIVDAVNNDVHYVYASDGAECYHEYECKFAFASAQRLTVYEAHFLGFKPCGRCNPPRYQG